MSKDATKRAEELAVTCDHTWGVIRGKGACAACIVRFVDAAVAEAVTERDEEIARLREETTVEAVATRAKFAIDRAVAEARREERERMAKKCESIAFGYVGTGNAVAQQCADEIRRPPASAPEGTT